MLLSGVNGPPNVVDQKTGLAGGDLLTLRVLSPFGPGRPSRIAGADFDIARQNFREFLRMRVDGTRPSGDRTDGSRCSPKQGWHSWQLLRRSATTGFWEPTDGGGASETPSNRIGTHAAGAETDIDMCCAADIGDATGNAGQTIAVPCAIINLCDQPRTFSWAASVAGGLMPSPAAGQVTLAAHTATTVPLDVAIPAGTAAGPRTIVLTVTAGADVCTEPGTVTVN